MIRRLWKLSIIPFIFICAVTIIFVYILYLPKMIKNKKDLLYYCDFNFLTNWLCKIGDFEKPELTPKYQRLKKLQKLQKINKKWYQF